jgi:Papain family cysteine protease
LEASAARRQAFQAYHDYLGSSSSSSSNNNNETTRQEAIQHAQRVERESFQLLNLSIQELLDCDTAVDQGCTGGNPLLAFDFIHRYGLVNADQYPYVGLQQPCRTQLTVDPVATVTAWGILPSNSERHMELALRYIGPVSVGVNGADPSFLSYGGGIFSKDGCKQGANHALLIVGYGQEETVGWDGNTTSTTRFWIARNSVRIRLIQTSAKLVAGLRFYTQRGMRDSHSPIETNSAARSGVEVGAKKVMYESNATTAARVRRGNAALPGVRALLWAGSCCRM